VISSILVAKCFDTPTSGIRNPEMGLDQRSTSNLDLTAIIISRFRISRFRHSCCKVFRHSNFRYPKPRNGVGSTVHIKPRSDSYNYFTISHIAISTFLLQSVSTLQLLVSETPKWVWINGPHQTSI
jgi:hypothetical protein